MKVPKLMLVVNGLPSFDDSGEIYLKTLCSNYPPEKLCRFSLVKGDSADIPDRWCGAPSSTTQIMQEQRFRRLGKKLSKLMRVPLHFYIRKFHARKMIADAVRFGREQSVELVWAALNSPQVIYIVQQIAIQLQVPFVLSIFDPPERMAYHLEMDSFSEKALMKDFAKCLRQATRIAVVSTEAMRDEYLRRYDVDSIVQLQGLGRTLKQPISESINDGANFTIGFAGFAYADQEFLALLAALDSVDWKIEGKEVILRILGPALNITSPHKVNIEYLGWRTLEETIVLMSKSDVNYIPYWFDNAFQLAARLSFPSKLSAYLASGRPVLVHAPEYASPSLFIDKYPVGLVCQSLISAEIIGTLERFIKEPELYAKMVKTSQETFDREFDSRIFLKRFSALIGFDPNAIKAELLF